MALDPKQEELRRATNPLFNDRKMKLGTFGTNVSNAVSFTTIDERFDPTWPNTRALALLADEMEFEAMVPVARWKGFGGATNMNGTNFEVYTWAAGLGALTENSCVLATSHVPTMHPVMAAKQATTIDHITNGRFALNVVCGWFRNEMQLFGGTLMEHDEAYGYAAEWLEVMIKLWTIDGEFDHIGKYFEIKGGFPEPKPIQQPFPAIMNAGKSDKGRNFAAKYCDMAFIIPQNYDLDDNRRVIDEYRRLAREEYGREIQVWSSAYVVQRDTEKEAQEYLNYYVVEKGDREGAANLLNAGGGGIKDRMDAPDYEELLFHIMAGWRGFPLVGTRDQVVDGLQDLSDIGLDGCLLVWADYESGMRQFKAETLPALIQAGLR